MVLAAFISASPKIRRQEIARADQVVPGERKQCRVFHFMPAAKLRSSQQLDVLAPAESLLDQLSRPEAQRVASVTGGAPVNRRAAVALDVLRHVGRRVDLSHLRDEAVGVVGLVGGDCAGSLPSDQSPAEAGRNPRRTFHLLLGKRRA
jgi:hypothetical protein